MTVSEVQPAPKSMVSRHLRGDHEGVMRAIDRYVAQIQLFAPEGLIPHVQQVFAMVEQVCGGGICRGRLAPAQGRPGQLP